MGLGLSGDQFSRFRSNLNLITVSWASDEGSSGLMMLESNLVVESKVDH